MVGGVKNSLGGYLSPAELEPGRFGKYPVTYSILLEILESRGPKMFSLRSNWNQSFEKVIFFQLKDTKTLILALVLSIYLTIFALCLYTYDKDK